MVNDFDIPSGAERSYFILFGVAAIYIATAPSGEPSFVAVSRDLGKSLTALQRKWPNMEITCAYWVRELALAQGIAREINRALPHLDEWSKQGDFQCEVSTSRREVLTSRRQLLSVRGEEAARLLVRIAVDRGISLTSHNAAMGRVRDAIAEIEARLTEANRRGDLAWFNAAYRDFRRQTNGSGMSYHAARARLRNAVVKQLIVQGINSTRTDLERHVFPRLPEAGDANGVDRVEKQEFFSREIPRGQANAQPTTDQSQDVGEAGDSASSRRTSRASGTVGADRQG